MPPFTNCFVYRTTTDQPTMVRIAKKIEHLGKPA